MVKSQDSLALARHLWCSVGLDTLGGHLGGLHGPCAGGPGTPSGVAEVSQWDALNHPWILVDFPCQRIQRGRSHMYGNK